MSQLRNTSFTKKRLKTSTQDKENVYCYSYGPRPERIHIHEKLDNLEPRFWSIKKGETVRIQGERGCCIRRKPEIYGLQSLKMHKHHHGRLRASRAGRSVKAARDQADAALESSLTDFPKSMSVTHTERATPK